VLNVNQHAATVDVPDLQMPQLGIPHARRVQDHEHRAIGEILRSIDQSGDFVRGEDRREPAWDLRKGHVFQHVRALQRLHKEEPERRDVELDRPRPELPLAQQVRLIRSQVALIELVRRRAKVLGESLDGLDVILNGGRGVVTPLEFFQHRLSEMGHRNLLVTHTLLGWPSAAHAERPPRQRLCSNAAVIRDAAPSPNQ
jgi:hypothetical protein